MEYLKSGSTLISAPADHCRRNSSLGCSVATIESWCQSFLKLFKILSNANKQKQRKITGEGRNSSALSLLLQVLLWQASFAFPKVETFILSLWLFYFPFLLGEGEMNNFYLPPVSSPSSGKRRWTMPGPCSFITQNKFSFSSPKNWRGKWWQALNIHSSYQSSSLTAFVI